MEVNAYVNFAGNFREAFDWYASVFDGAILYSETFGDRVSEMPGMSDTASDREKIMHMAIRIGNAIVMGSDSPPSWYQPPQGMHISVGFTDLDAAGRTFNQLADGGQVTMPFAKTFWADGFGMVTDRFSVPWMINSTQPCDPDET